MSVFLFPFAVVLLFISIEKVCVYPVYVHGKINIRKGFLHWMQLTASNLQVKMKGGYIYGKTCRNCFFRDCSLGRKEMKPRQISLGSSLSVLNHCPFLRCFDVVTCSESSSSTVHPSATGAWPSLKPCPKLCLWWSQQKGFLIEQIKDMSISVQLLKAV